MLSSLLLQFYGRELGVELPVSVVQAMQNGLVMILSGEVDAGNQSTCQQHPGMDQYRSGSSSEVLSIVRLLHGLRSKQRQILRLGCGSPSSCQAKNNAGAEMLGWRYRQSPAPFRTCEIDLQVLFITREWWKCRSNEPVALVLLDTVTKGWHMNLSVRIDVNRRNHQLEKSSS